METILDNLPTDAETAEADAELVTEVISTLLHKITWATSLMAHQPATVKAEINVSRTKLFEMLGVSIWSKLVIMRPGVPLPNEVRTGLVRFIDEIRTIERRHQS